MSIMIRNPILTGFNPDPSIAVAGRDFYIATSTFEWFPGVQIHHSRDLVNWRLLGRALGRVSQLDLRGAPHSCGVWAPCLSYADGLFWLVFANVKSFGGSVTDSLVMVATAEDSAGPWSETTRLCADGFDPSLFHDDDGKKYLVNMTMGEPGSKRRFNGITMQEFDPEKRCLVGPRKMIWPGTGIFCTEGPHLYRKDGWYYLLAAEGGTGQNHCVSMARSRDIWGPYENAPNNPILTSRDDPDNPLQAAGHGDLFQTPDGGWWTTTGLAAAGLSAASGYAAEKPNVVFILLDDLGKEWVSCYGATDIQTPRIDALAAGGMRFQNVYSMPQCTPSRMCLLTGQYPYRNGWVNHWDVPRWGAGARYDPGSFPCNLGLTMRTAGYATAIAGKWQINDFRVESDALDKAGFDDWCMWTGGEAGNPPSNNRYWDPYIYTKDTPSRTYEGAFGPDMFCNFVIDFARRQHAGGRPFFIYYPMILTHTPFTTTPLEPDAKSKVDKHKAMVRYADHLLGRIVDAFTDMGIARNTLIIFTSDNGTCTEMVGHMGERAIRGGKAKTIEPGVNIPFIVNWPGVVPAGRVSEELTDFTDIIPTLAELAGLPVPAKDKVDGVSIVPYLRGQVDHIPRNWILAMGGQNNAKVSDKGVENEWYFRDRVVRDKRYKLYVGTDRHPWKFFDLESDPEEAVDLTGREEGAARQSRERLEGLIASWAEQDADFICTPQPPQPWDKPASVTSGNWKKGRP